MVPAGAATADALPDPPAALVHDVIRLRLADEVRISLEHAWFPVALFPDLLGERLDDSIYELMAHRYGLRAVKAVERLAAVLADAGQAALLGIEAGDPLMAIERIAYDGTDQPLEYSTDLFRGGPDPGHRLGAWRRRGHRRRSGEPAHPGHGARRPGRAGGAGRGGLSAPAWAL
jgi:GntR family transcriptional regulator